MQLNFSFTCKFIHLTSFQDCIVQFLAMPSWWQAPFDCNICLAAWYPGTIWLSVSINSYDISYQPPTDMQILSMAPQSSQNTQKSLQSRGIAAYLPEKVQFHLHSLN
jgi:hypothetical protein